jgi:energy-coupling factor transport system ATP-binding protein
VLAALRRMVHDHGLTVLLAEHRLERVAAEADLALGFAEGRVSVGLPSQVLPALGLGPPVARLGELLGWDPVPLTIREARRMAPEPPPARSHPPASRRRGRFWSKANRRGPVVWPRCARRSPSRSCSPGRWPRRFASP